MNPATLQPDHVDHADDPVPVIRETQRLTPASHSYLEPQGEGILFAAFCLISSLIIYCGVILIRFLG